MCEKSIQYKVSQEHPIKKIWAAILFPAILLILLWLFYFLQFLSGGSLGYLGILPQHVEGLKGILMSPLIHGDFNHLLSNSFPLFILTLIINMFYRKVAILSFFMIYFFTGLTVWLFARPVYHIGASGVVYGLLSFIFWTGIFRRNTKSIILALLVGFLYSGFIWGVIPVEEGVSWESHLFGGLVGIVVAYIMRKFIEDDEQAKLYSYELDERENSDHYYYERDIFDRTEN